MDALKFPEIDTVWDYDRPQANRIKIYGIEWIASYGAGFKSGFPTNAQYNYSTIQSR
jgi:hypothetical protein